MAGEWETVELGEVAAVRSGYAFKSSEWREAGVPVVKIANVKGGRLEMTGCSFVSESTAAESGEFQISTGDILIAMTGYIGEVARVRRLDLPCVLNQRVGKFSVRDEERLDADFLYTFLSWAETRQTIEGLGYGSAQANVSPSLIHKVEIPLPPLADQKAIAAVLGALDDKIELNRQMNATLEAMARALFQSWFVDFEPVRAKAAAKAAGAASAAIERAAMAAIAGRSIEEAITQEDFFEGLSLNEHALLSLTASLFPATFYDSEVGEIPECWSVSCIGDLCDRVFSGGTPQTTNLSFWDGGIPWLSSGETRKRFITNTDKTIARRGVECSSTREARSGAVVIASAGQGKTRGQTSFLGLDTYINQSVIALEADLSKVTDVFLYFNLAPRYEQFRQLSDAHSSRGSLTTKLLAGIYTTHPEPSLIERFDAIASPIVQRILANERESVTLAQLRDSLIPKLLRGELTVG